MHHPPIPRWNESAVGSGRSAVRPQTLPPRHQQSAPLSFWSLCPLCLCGICLRACRPPSDAFESYRPAPAPQHHL